MRDGEKSSCEKCCPPARVMALAVLGIKVSEQGTARAFNRFTLINVAWPLMDREVSWDSREHL